MKPVKQKLLSLATLAVVLVLTAALLPLPGSASTDTDAYAGSFSASTGTGSSSGDTVDTPEPQDRPRIHAGYSFGEGDALIADVGKTYPLLTKTFGSDAVKDVAGYRERGMSGYVTLDPALFSRLNQFSMGFWAKFSLSSAKGKTTLFRVEGENDESLELAFSTQGKSVYLQLSIDDGSRVAFCSYDVTSVLGDEAMWYHFAFTYKKADSASLIQLYVNGKSSSSSGTTSFIDLSALEISMAAFQGVTLDELYLTNFALEPAKISSMMNQAVATFYSSEQKEIDGSSSGSGADSPLQPSAPGNAYAYSWAAYLFEGTYTAGADYNSGNVPAVVDNSCTRIDSSRLKTKFGYGIIRRDGTAPAYYLKADARLVQDQTDFTFTAWVYRSGNTKVNEECLLDLNGQGILRFAPYVVGADGTPSAYLEYTDSRGKVQHSRIGDGELTSPQGQWVHYALTFANNGTVTVYVDGVKVADFAAGISPANLSLTDCRVVTGVSSSDTSRTVLDEVYFTPRALSDAEIRKIHFYGLEKYTSEVLPDPGSQSSGGEEQTGDPGNVNAPDDTDLAEDAFTKVGSILKGFIGTTFDERSSVGRDWNGGADATVTGERLTNGISSYGLALDGASTFLRYPTGILDNVQSLTVSLSYSWDGPASGNSRSQRLFDFSRKTSSVAEPAASIYLETGLGFGGMRLVLDDGITSTVVPYDYNEIGTWTRVTVTVDQGIVTLYLDETAVASASTSVDLSSICPNFCYVGRSGVKGDPLFKGAVDEIYISNEALSADEVGRWMNGISAAVADPVAEEEDGWDTIIAITVVFAILLIAAVIALVVVILVRRAKRPRAEKPTMPVSPGSEAAIGPRSARRARMEAEEAQEGDTVKFRKVQEEPGSVTADADATATFRKVGTDPAPAATDETAVFRKVDSDSADHE